MAYKKRTEHLKLPNWELHDKPDMHDFNQAFVAIDEMAGEIEETIAELKATLKNLAEQKSDKTDCLGLPKMLGGGGDLNDYRTPGMYYCPLTSDAINTQNTPIDHAFSLLVERHAGFKQTFTNHMINQTPSVYIRNYYDGTWGKWYKVNLSES